MGQAQSRMNDAELIREAQRGNHAAPRSRNSCAIRCAVLRLAYHLTRSEQDAQDIYQEAFLKAYRNIDNFRFECSFYSGFTASLPISASIYCANGKSVRKIPPPVDSDGDTYDLIDQVADERSGASPERDLMRRELGGRIARALTKLTPRERMVFEMKHYQGLKLRTIGEILNTTEETAKNTLFRGTQKLRAALKDIK